MATTSSLLGRGLGLVLVEFQYEYKDRDGTLVSIKPNERYVLLAKTNDHWWQVRSDHNSKPFYIPAKYVKELPTDLPLPLDFADPPSAEPVPVPVATPVPVPVPVPVPKTLEETSGSRTKPGDEVTIRLRPDGYRKTENRMSTFGVPLDFHDLSHLVVPAPRHPGNSHADSTETGNIITSRTTNMVDSVSKKQSHLTGVLDSNKDPGKLRVPNFSPSDPLSVPRPHTQPIPVVLPVIPAVPLGPVVPVVPAAPGVSVVPAAPGVSVVPAAPGVSVVPAAPGVSVVPAATLAPDVNLTPVIHPHKNPHSRSSPSTSCHDNHSSTVDSEKEEELLEEEVSMEESGEEEESFPKDEDSNHIYESIQDLNLDVEALTGARPGALSEPAPAPAPAQNHSSPGPNTAIYANVSSLKKSLVPQISISSPISPPPPPSEPAPTPPLHTPSSTVSSSGMMSPTSPLSPQDGWQVHTDQDSGKVFYYHPGTKQSTWSDPHSPPSLPAGDVDQFRRIEERQLSSTSSQPPLPVEDYPVEEPDGNDVVFTHPQQQNVGLIPRAQLDLKDGNRRLQEVPHLPQRLLGNGVSQEETPLQVKNWRHNVAEDTFAPGHRRNVSDLTEVTNRRHSPDGPQGHLLEKAGIINKTKVADHGKKIRKNWGQSWTVLHGGILTFHKDPKSNPTGNAMKSSQIVPEYTVELKGAAVSWASKDKSSKKNVLELKTRQGCEYLMQYDTESVISDWHRVILDAIKQLEHDHLTEDEEEDTLEKEGKDKKRTSTTNSSSTAESEQRQVRTKLRRFLQRRPTLQNVKDKGYIRDNIFGCHLDTLCHRENSTIPKFVEKCIKSVERRGLDVDGIYRVSGNLAVIQKLRYKVDREEQLDLEDGQWEEIHVITGALKLFLRELPEPLFPFSCFDKFIAAIQVPDYSLRVSYMKDLVRSLPLPNHDTMELLFKHLRKVIEHKDSNRMSVQSVAIVFGPTLLRPETESADMTIHMVFQSQIVELILKEFQTIFSQK